MQQNSLDRKSIDRGADGDLQNSSEVYRINADNDRPFRCDPSEFIASFSSSINMLVELSCNELTTQHIHTHSHTFDHPSPQDPLLSHAQNIHTSPMLTDAYSLLAYRPTDVTQQVPQILNGVSEHTYSKPTKVSIGLIIQRRGPSSYL